MGVITDWMTAVGADGSGLIAAMAVVPAVKAIGESRRLREDQSRPFVVVTFEPPSGGDRKFLDLVVRNQGKTIARNVKFLFDKPLRTTTDEFGYAISDVKFLRDGIEVLAPGAEYRVLFDFIPARLQANERSGDMPDSYQVIVQYSDKSSTPLEPEEYILDSALSRSAPYVQEVSMDDFFKELVKLRETVKSFQDVFRNRQF